MELSNRTEWLFFHLWRKNPKTKEPCQGVLIPDTIFFRWAKQHAWYKTVPGRRRLVRIISEKIRLDQVYKEMTAAQSVIGVSSVYHYGEMAPQKRPGSAKKSNFWDF